MAKDQILLVNPFGVAATRTCIPWRNARTGVEVMSTSNSNRIDATFAALKANGQQKALIPFITAGDPSLDSTLPTMHALAMAGADVIELGCRSPTRWPTAR